MHSFPANSGSLRPGGNRGKRIEGVRFQTKIVDLSFQIVDLNFQIVDLNFQIVDLDFQIVDLDF